MRFFTQLAINFYVLVITVLSVFVLLFTFHVFTMEEVTFYLQDIYTQPQMAQVVRVVSGILILLSFLFARVLSGGRQREKTIAFDNPSGRVSISLNAVEDLVRRLMQKIPEVKEVRPSIVATKRGLQIDVRLILRADVNIPEMTSRLQELVKNKIQDVIGIEENVSVRIHIGKIIMDEGRTKGKGTEEEKKGELSVPFQGYRS